jgi:hypothetical protein
MPPLLLILLSYRYMVKLVGLVNLLVLLLLVLPADLSGDEKSDKSLDDSNDGCELS